MIEEKQRKIIEKMNDSDEIKKFKILEKKIKNNNEYNRIISEFEKQNITNEEIIKLRRELFEIDGVREYAKLETQIRLFSKEVSDIISSVVDKEKC